MHNDTDFTIVQVVTRPLAIKLKYNFSNQCYNNIMKLIIDLIPMEHNMLKDLYLSKKIVFGLAMNYEDIDVCKNNYMLF
jgi:hypothetical protein